MLEGLRSKIGSEIVEHTGITVYTGELLENFIAGAITESGHVFYDKSKIPDRYSRLIPHPHPELYVDRTGMAEPLRRALIKANEFGDNSTPIILQGSVPRFAEYTRVAKRVNNSDIIIPEATPLLILKVWIPKVDWNLYDPSSESNNPYKIITEINPLDLLSQS